MKVKVYTNSTCPYCEKISDFLRSYGVEFETISVDELSGAEQEEAIAEAYRLSGQRSFPVTDIDGSAVIGFDMVKLKKLLGIEEKTEPAKAGTEKKGDGKILERLKDEARRTGYTLNPDEDMAKAFVSGLQKNEARYGYRFCPCRLATGDYSKDCDLICPCAYRDSDLDTYGRCYCGLYVTEEFIKSGKEITPIPDSRKSTWTFRPKEAKEKDVCEVLSLPVDKGVKEIVKVFSYVLGKEDREALKEEFERVTRTLGIEKVIWHGETAEGARETGGGGRLSLKFLQGMEGLVYILKTSPDRDGHISRDALKICPDPLQGSMNKLYQLDIFVGRSSEGLLSKNVKGQRLSDGTIVLSGYLAEADSRRYLITPGADTDTDGVVDEIVRLETCYNLLLSQRQKYLLLADQISRVDEGIATKMGVINLNISRADGETLKGWLQDLIVNFGEIAGIAEELKKHSSDTEGRRNVLQSILERWKGEPVEGLQTISEPLQFYTSTVGDDYGRLIQRIEGIRSEMRDVITILRARVDIIQQEQSLDTQKDMHETAKTQLKMQRAVERLEVLIGTYYMTVLAEMAFEAMEARGRHLPASPIILSVYLIPVFLVFAIFLSGKIGHFIETRRDRFRGKDDDE